MLLSLDEILDIFQEFADEYHMTRSHPGLYDDDLPENIYYMIGPCETNILAHDIYEIEVWCDSDNGLGEETKKMFNTFFDNVESLLNKLRGFGYTIIDSKKTSTGFVSGPWTYKLKIGE